MNFDSEMKKKVADIELLIREYLPKEDGFQKTLLKAANYSMLAGGKRLRPLIMQESCLLFGDGCPELAPFMAAIEMIHTFSLVHDDLPAMDADEYRRGRKTTWAVYGDDMAILAGDALAVYAFETAAKAFKVTARPEITGRCIGILAEKTGVFGMIGGQSADVETSGMDLSEEKLDFIYRLKTGALIEAAMMTGALLGGADEDEVRIMEKVAGNVGLAFQIQDDILDVTGTTETLGKPAGSDRKNGKTTYVTVNGIDKARTQVREYTETAISLLEGLPVSSGFLNELLIRLINREN